MANATHPFGFPAFADSYALPADVRVGHIHLLVADLDRAVAFYRDAIGMKLLAYGPDEGIPMALLAAGDYHHHVALSAAPDPFTARVMVGALGMHHFALVYPDRDALANAMRRVLRYGHQIDTGVDHGRSMAIYLRDPDGNNVELSYDRPRSQWFDAQGRTTLRNVRFDPMSLLESKVEAA
jgi:catechol 2,3-dioxygenase